MLEVKGKKWGGERVVTVRNKNDKSGNFLQQSLILRLENISFELLSTSLFIVSNFCVKVIDYLPTNTD